MNQNTIEPTPTWPALAELAVFIRDPIPNIPPTPPAEAMGSVETICAWLNTFERQHAPAVERLIVEAVNAGMHMSLPSAEQGWLIRERMNFVARWALAMGAEFFPHGSLAEGILWSQKQLWERAGRFHLVDTLAGAWWLAHQERRAGEQSVLNLLLVLPPQELAFAPIDCDLRGAAAQDILPKLHAAMQAQVIFPELQGYKFSFGAVALARVIERQLDLNFETIPLLEVLRDIGHELGVQVIVTKNEAVFMDPADEPAWPYFARYAFPETGQSLCLPQPQLENFLAQSGVLFVPGESGAWYDEAEGCVLLYNRRSEHRLIETIIEALREVAARPAESWPGDSLEGMS